MLPGGQLLADLPLLVAQADLGGAFASQCGGELGDDALALDAGLLCLGGPGGGAISGGFSELDTLMLDPEQRGNGEQQHQAVGELTQAAHAATCSCSA